MLELNDREALQSILDALQTGVCLVDRNGKILLWNSSAERITGYLKQDALGKSIHEDFLERINTKSQELFGADAPLETALREGKSDDAWASLRHKSGRRIPVWLHASPIRNAHGWVTGAVESFDETLAVADWNRRRSKLAAYGCLDEASGVLNHSMIHSHLRETLNTFAEHPLPFSILFVTIDHLDKLKAWHGPGSVPPVFRMVAQTIENSLRPTDFVGRWDTDGFLAILAGCNHQEVSETAERLRRLVAQAKTEWWGDNLSVTVSIGATTAKCGDTVEGVLLRAQHALSTSIEQGGDRRIVLVQD